MERDDSEMLHIPKHRSFAKFFRSCTGVLVCSFMPEKEYKTDFPFVSDQCTHYQQGGGRGEHIIAPKVISLLGSSSDW